MTWCAWLDNKDVIIVSSVIIATVVFVSILLVLLLTWSEMFERAIDRDRDRDRVNYISIPTHQPSETTTQPPSRMTIIIHTYPIEITETTTELPSYVITNIIHTDPIRIMDSCLYLTKKTQLINESYSVVWIEVNLQITLKNTGDKIVTIRNITVDGLKLEGFTPFNINPGETITKSYPVILNPATGETRILFDPRWEKGTRHTVIVTYVVLGSTLEERVSHLSVVV